MTSISQSAVEDAVTMLARKIGAEIQLSIWSPGDGWTRYQMVGGPLSSRVWRGAELHAACWLAIDAVEADRGRHAATFQNSAPGDA